MFRDGYHILANTPHRAANFTSCSITVGRCHKASYTFIFYNTGSFLSALVRSLAARTQTMLLRLAIAAVAVLLAAGAEWAPGISVPDEWLRDQFIRGHVVTTPEPRVLVVDIDEASLASHGNWPWPRSRLADLVEILLGDYAARGVALDIVLPQPADADGDMRLGMLARHGPLVLAQAFDYNALRPQHLRAGVPAGGKPGTVRSAPLANGYIANQAAWADVPHVGNIGFLPDPDGALRRLPMYTGFDGRSYPALSLALLDCCSGGPALTPPATLRVAYRRDWTAYTVVSAGDILDRTIAAPDIAGRLVIVGSSSLGLGDRVTTPLAASRPGLGVQATMLSTLLDIQAGTAPVPWPGRWIALAFSAVLAALAVLAFSRLPALGSAVLLAVAAVVWLWLASRISVHDGTFSPGGPLLGILWLLAVGVPYQWQLAQRRSRALLNTLRQYVAPGVVRELLRSDMLDPLVPRELEVTTLIADMEGYTTQVEAIPVAEAAALTRAFLDCLTGPVIRHQGTLDKYTGDGLVAFWGAPLPQADHADMALDAAQDIVERVRVLSEQRQRDGRPPLRVRIGIESGLAVAGDFGTSFRSIYTAVGDSVNTASRLEQAARDFPYDVIVGAGTATRSRRHQFLQLGERLLRGKEKPVTLYTIDTMSTPAPNAAGPAT